MYSCNLGYQLEVVCPLEASDEDRAEYQANRVDPEENGIFGREIDGVIRRYVMCTVRHMPMVMAKDALVMGQSLV